MNKGAQAFSTVLTDKEHESLKRDKVSIMKNEFMNFKLWKINAININFLLDKKEKSGGTRR